METWLQLGIAGGALVVIVALLRRGRRRRSNAIDVGRVSDAWLAEQRGAPKRLVLCSWRDLCCGCGSAL